MEGFEGGSISAGNGAAAKTTTQGAMPAVASGLTHSEAASSLTRSETGVETQGVRPEAAGVEDDRTSGPKPAEAILAEVKTNGLDGTMRALAEGKFSGDASEDAQGGQENPLTNINSLITQADQDLKKLSQDRSAKEGDASTTESDDKDKKGIPTEGMRQDARYQAIEKELIKKWLQENPGKDTLSFEGQNYTLGHLGYENRHLPTLTSDAERLFRERFPEEAQAYDAKAAVIGMQLEQEFTQQNPNIVAKRQSETGGGANGSTTAGEQPRQGTEPRLSAIRGDNPGAVADQLRNDLIRNGAATEVSTTSGSVDATPAQVQTLTQGGERDLSAIRGGNADAAADRLARNLEQAGVATRVDTSAAETTDAKGDQGRQEAQAAQGQEGKTTEQDKQARQQELSEKIKAGTATPEEMREYRDTKLNTEQRKQELTQKALDASITDEEIEELYKLNQGMEAERQKSGKEASMSTDMQEALKALNKLTQNPEFVNAFSGLLKLAGQEGNSILSALQKELQEVGAAAGEMNQENLDDQDEQELQKHPILYFLYLLMKAAVKTTAKVAQAAAPISEKATKN